MAACQLLYNVHLCTSENFKDGCSVRLGKVKGATRDIGIYPLRTNDVHRKVCANHWVIKIILLRRPWIPTPNVM